MSSPATAQPSGDTVVTFTVATSNLVIHVPASVNLGSGFPGSTISGQLGTVQVVDSRAALAATWIASVTSTAFTTGSGTPAETISNQNVDYWSGMQTASTGTGTLLPDQPTAADAVSLDVPRTAFSKTTGSGDNTVSWNPTLEISVPATAVGGLYSGTVTHSVV
ncbi:hypothetical protein GCM10027280_33880 [Micromonospora polyrhachis]|uniref:WxL domain-containing protein n=1 Tax=Micromonospora polyrhachis TaxID=1282883 RepID=A0A7W7WQ11_9ACTN|nr:hypothetical protein [Micromonospora polyrhachis]MBB4959540.1 hypothetical protein [Micromonospora polyrhachis]